MARLARRDMRGERTELVLNRHHFISSFVGGLDGLDMLVGSVVLNIKDLRLLALASIRASNIAKKK